MSIPWRMDTATSVRAQDGTAVGYSDSGNHSRAILRLMVGGSAAAVRRGRDLILTCTCGMIAPFDGSRARSHLNYEWRRSPATPSGKIWHTIEDRGKTRGALRAIA